MKRQARVCKFVKFFVTKLQQRSLWPFLRLWVLEGVSRGFENRFLLDFVDFFFVYRYVSDFYYVNIFLGEF